MGKIVTLDTSHPAVIHLCNRDKRLAKVITMVGTIAYKPHGDGFAFLVHEIIEQMLSVQVGKIIYNRLVALCEGAITPTAIHSLSIDDIKSTGTSSNKASYIKGLADSIMSEEIVLEALTEYSSEEIIKQLTQLRGIGQWTAKMYLIFVLDRQDILPYEDSAFLQSYRWLYKTSDTRAESIQKKCRKWKPFSSVAARYLYKALDLGLTKDEFHLYK